jgi:predicted lipoprotein with Yx(FWY)xxD motif
MKKLIRNATSIALFSLMVIAVSRCSKNNSAPTSAKKINIQSNSTFGKILTDKDGRTLYSFANDVSGQSSCTGDCQNTWSPFYVDNLTGGDLGDPDLKITDFASITTASGKKQLTYKGWPLYYHTPGGSPEAAGQTTGDGILGLWFVAKPDYTIMLANTQLIGGDNNHYKSDYTVGDGNTVFFTDAVGSTLYTFSKDSANHNRFTKQDFSNNALWPIYDTANIVVPSILDKTLFTKTNVFGREQLTYNGWPLYHFGADAGVRGSTKGITFVSVGLWRVPVKDIVAAPAQ